VNPDLAKGMKEKRRRRGSKEGKEEKSIGCVCEVDLFRSSR